MNYTVEVNVWGKTFVDVEATCEDDAMDIACEIVDFDSVDFEREAVDVRPDFGDD